MCCHPTLTYVNSKSLIITMDYSSSSLRAGIEPSEEIDDIDGFGCLHIPGPITASGRQKTFEEVGGSVSAKR